MQRFFVEPHQIDRDRHEIRITGNDVNHIVNVLRMKKDEELWISDKEKEYHCVIETQGRMKSCFISSMYRSQIMSCRTVFIFFRDCRRLIRWS